MYRSEGGFVGRKFLSVEYGSVPIIRNEKIDYKSYCLNLDSTEGVNMFDNLLHLMIQV